MVWGPAYVHIRCEMCHLATQGFRLGWTLEQKLAAEEQAAVEWNKRPDYDKYIAQFTIAQDALKRVTELQHVNDILEAMLTQAQGICNTTQPRLAEALELCWAAQKWARDQIEASALQEAIETWERT
jgi:hypothetical protein